MLTRRPARRVSSSPASIRISTSTKLTSRTSTRGQLAQAPAHELFVQFGQLACDTRRALAQDFARVRQRGCDAVGRFVEDERGGERTQSGESGAARRRTGGQKASEEELVGRQA